MPPSDCYIFFKKTSRVLIVYDQHNTAIIAIIAAIRIPTHHLEFISSFIVMPFAHQLTNHEPEGLKHNKLHHIRDIFLYDQEANQVYDLKHQLHVFHKMNMNEDYSWSYS